MQTPDLDIRTRLTKVRAGDAVRALREMLLHGRHALACIFDQGLVSGTNFVTTLLLARMCTNSELGLYFLVWTVVLFLRGAQTNVISAPYLVFCTRHAKSESMDYYAGSTLVQQTVLLGATEVLLLMCVAILYFAAVPQTVLALAVVLAVILPVVLMREYFRQLALAHLDLRSVLALDLTGTVLQIGGLVLLGYAGLLSPVSAYFTIGGASAAACFVWWLVAQPTFRISAGRILKDAARNWRFGRWVLASQLASSSIDIVPWILAAFHGSAAAGIFAACNSLVGVLNPFVQGSSNYVNTKSARTYETQGPSGLRRLLLVAAGLFVLVLAPIALAALFLGDAAATLLYGDKFPAVACLIALLTLDQMLSALTLTATGGLRAAERPAAAFTADLVELGVTLLASIWFISSLGVLGAALAVACGRSAGAFFRWAAVLRTTACARRYPSGEHHRPGLGRPASGAINGR